MTLPPPGKAISKISFIINSQALLGILARTPWCTFSRKLCLFVQRENRGWVRQFRHIPVALPSSEFSFCLLKGIPFPSRNQHLPRVHIPSLLPKSVFLNFCAISNFFSLVFVFNLQIRFSLPSVWKEKRKKWRGRMRQEKETNLKQLNIADSSYLWTYVFLLSPAFCRASLISLSSCFHLLFTLHATVLQLDSTGAILQMSLTISRSPKISKHLNLLTFSLRQFVLCALSKYLPWVRNFPALNGVKQRSTLKLT